MSEPTRRDLVDDRLARKILALAGTSVFGSLDTTTLQRVAGIAEWRVVAAGAFVFSRGDVGEHLFVIDKGHVRIVASASDGREVVLNLLGPGTVFGEMAFTDGRERTADAVTTEASELLALSRRRLLPLVVSQPELVLQLMAALCERARWLAEAYEDSAFLDLPARLAKRLLVLSRSFGYDTPQGRRLVVSLPHREIAAHMNVTRESISRLVQKLQQDGIIEERRGVMVLKDVPRLEQLARGGYSPGQVRS
ncbi:MAG: Crp/Fnr family transcriptional regulator [Rhizomicrobium sp.]